MQELNEGPALAHVTLKVISVEAVGTLWSYPMEPCLHIFIVNVS